MTICVVKKKQLFVSGRDDLTTLQGTSHYSKVWIMSKIVTAVRVSVCRLPVFLSVCLSVCLSI